MNNLLASKSVNDWKSALSGLPLLVQKYSLKRKTTTNTNIKELDQWYRLEIGLLVKKRKEPHLRKEELMNIVKWKLVFSSFNPVFLNRINKNSNHQVEQLTKQAFHVLDSGDCKNIECVLESIEVLKKLTGIGFATATAVLAAYNENIPFMSHEISRVAIKSKKIQYSKIHYKQVFSFCSKIAQKVEGISVRDVQDAIWITVKTANEKN